MTVTNPSSLNTDFITFNIANRVVAWNTNTNNQVGTYTITITGKIVAAQTFETTLSFPLTVTASCLASTETN